jgi:hypothetical protein
LRHEKFNFIIRYENIQDDFAEVIKLLGVEQKRDLPLKNKTQGKKNYFTSYYTPDIYDRAKRVFVSYMKK